MWMTCCCPAGAAAVGMLLLLVLASSQLLLGVLRVDGSQRAAVAAAISERAHGLAPPEGSGAALQHVSLAFFPD